MTSEQYDIENNFSYHKPFGDQPKRYEELRSKAKELTNLILENCPESDERQIAMRRLEDSIMWANASIARNERMCSEAYRVYTPSTEEE